MLKNWRCFKKSSTKLFLRVNPLYPLTAYCSLWLQTGSAVTALFDNYLKQIKPQEEKENNCRCLTRFAPKLRLLFKEKGREKKNKIKKWNMHKVITRYAMSWYVMTWCTMTCSCMHKVVTRTTTSFLVSIHKKKNYNYSWYGSIIP